MPKFGASMSVGGGGGGKRPYMAGRFALEIDNNAAGWIFSADGGHRSSEVVNEKAGGELIVRKHVAQTKFEDITISCGIGMSKSFYQWMKDSVDFNFTRKDGAIHTADYDFKIQRSLEFHSALLSEIGFPGLDASSKETAKLTLKIKPEWTKTIVGSGNITHSAHPIKQGVQQRWSPSNFRLNIDGLDCTRVNKIEPLSVKQKITTNSLGETNIYGIEPTGLELPHLVITLPESHAEAFYKWEEDFLLRGNCSAECEKTATLFYLTPDLKDVLFSISMANIGIFKLTADKLDAGSESLRRVKAEMYVEEFTFNFENGATWA